MECFDGINQNTLLVTSPIKLILKRCDSVLMLRAPTYGCA